MNNKTIKPGDNYVNQFSYGSNLDPQKHPILEPFDGRLSNNIISYKLKNKISGAVTDHEIPIPNSMKVTADSPSKFLVQVFVTPNNELFFLVARPHRHENGAIFYPLYKASAQGITHLYFVTTARDLPDRIVGYDAAHDILYITATPSILNAIHLYESDQTLKRVRFLQSASPLDRLLYFIAPFVGIDSMRNQLLANPDIGTFITNYAQELFPDLYKKLDISQFLTREDYVE